MASKSRILEILIQAKDKTKKGVKSALLGLGKIKKLAGSAMAATAVAGGVAAFGLAKLGGSAIDTASNFENLELSLTTTLGSLEKAQKAIRYANKEAAASPYTVMEYGEAIRTLSAYGIEYSEVMETLGNTAASMGKPLQQAVEALADAMQGEGERLKEFGIKQSVAGDQITYTWVDAMGKVRKTIAENNPQIIKEALAGIWNEKYAGGMKAFSSSWTGLTSTVKSLWDELTLAVMNSGVFTWLKTGLDQIIKTVNQLKETGQFQAKAEAIGKAVINIGNAMVQFIPSALIFILEVIAKISMGIRGWQMLIGEAKIAGLTFAAFMQGVIRDIAKIAAVVLDKLDIWGIYKGKVRDLVDIAQTQSQIVKQLNTDKDKAIQQQQQTIDGYTKEQREIEGYKQKVAGMKDSFDDFIGTVNKAVEAQKGIGDATKVGVDKAVSEVDRLADAYARLARAQGVYLDRANAARAIQNGDSLGLLAAAAEEAEKSQ